MLEFRSRSKAYEVVSLNSDYLQGAFHHAVSRCCEESGIRVAVMCAPGNPPRMAGFLSNRYIPEGCIEEIKDIRDNEIEFENGSLLVYSIGLKNIDDGDFDAIIIADWDTKVGKYYYEIGGLSGADAVISISDSLTEYMSGNNPNGVRDFLGEFSVNSV